MHVFASFSSDGPTGGAIVAGGIATVLLLALLRRSSNVRSAAIGGAAGTGAIALLVFGSGGGDMDGLCALFLAPLFAIVGALIGVFVFESGNG